MQCRSIANTCHYDVPHTLVAWKDKHVRAHVSTAPTQSCSAWEGKVPIMLATIHSMSYLHERLFHQVQAPNAAIIAGSVEVVAGGWGGGEAGGVDGPCVGGVVAHTIMAQA